MDHSCVWIFLLSLSISHVTVTAEAEACRTVVQADMVFLVDESWSVEQSGFASVKDFVSAVVSSFRDNVVGEDGVRFGVTVYGDIPRMRIALSDYSSLGEVLAAIRDLPYEGGASRTGDALQFLVDYVFSPAIARDHTPKIAVLITSGRSDDQVDGASRAVADAGITLFAVGVRGADESELRTMVTEPYEEHLMLGADFSLLGSLVPKLSRRLCVTASEPPRPVRTAHPEEQVVGPRDLQVFELGHSSLRLTWSQATGDVTGYRLLVTPLSPKGLPLPSQQRQIDLKGDVSTTLVTELGPKTRYTLTIYAIYPDLVGDSAAVNVLTLPVPVVSNFRVIEEGLFSLRMAWTPPLGKINAFKIFIPRSNRPGFAYEQLLPGDVSSHVIDSLEEDKKYTVTLYAVYPQGPSDPVSVVGKTLKLIPVQELLVQNATTDTVQARWAPVKGATGYRLTWASPDGHIENINLGENFNFYMVQGLHQASEYTVTINPIFVDVEGPVTTVTASTLESSSVQTLKAVAVNTNSAVISWNSVPGATGYRLAWGPTPEFLGRDRPRQLALNGSTTSHQLKSLAHDTEYVLSLYVLFGPAVGPGITATFRTSPLGYVSNFKVSSYTSSSIHVEWSPIVGATEYKLSWSLKDGGSPQTRYLDRSTLFHRIEGLSPESSYTVSIHAVYGNTEGPEISLSQLTAAVSDSERIPTVREVSVVDIGVNFFTLAWKQTPGVSGYKLSWSHFLGGDEKSELLPAATTAFTIRGLQESSAYKIQVSSMVGSREGSPALVTARTLDLPKVNGFAALNLTDSSAVLNWTSVGGASGYVLSWRHISELETKTETLGPGVTSFKMVDLLYGRTYIFTIRPLYGEMEGPITTLYQRILSKNRPLVRVPDIPATSAPDPSPITPTSKTKTPTTTKTPPSKTSTHAPPSKTLTTKKPPSKPKVTVSKTAAVTTATGQVTSTASSQRTVNTATTTSPPGPVCGKAKADVVFLVDESSSIGVDNFMKIKDFIFRVSTYFPFIGPHGTQIAVVHYSDDPRIEFNLGDYKDRNSVLRALRGLRYGGGNTRTGKGISYVLKELFQESVGMRQDVAHVLVLITDGRAIDDVVPPSRIARALGVSVLAVGVANADLEELRKIASPTTSYKNIFYAQTFEDLPSVEREFINNICSETLLSEFKLEAESAQLDTPTDDPEEPQGPCPANCVKGQKGEQGDGFGVGGLKLRQSPGQFNPFSSSKGEMGDRASAEMPTHLTTKQSSHSAAMFSGQGPPGIDGVPGFPGRPGRGGPPGSAGLRGPQGIPGDLGRPGSTGSKGQRGERGEPGYVIGGPEAGYIPGRKGEPGSSGPHGPPGISGGAGPPGLPGQPGPPGSPGASVKGEAGEVGLKGLRGKQGLKGDTGEEGKDGIAGLPGPIGIDGVPGLPGQKGGKGEEGIGIQGVQGPRGERGEQGNIGLTGPVGPKGEAGDQGVQGVIGPRGKKGLKGDQGDMGGQGEGGPIGPHGPIGLTGANGQKGDEGQRGSPGDPAKGIIGPTGKKGARGDIGPVGPAGPQGTKGQQGVKGDKGSPGFGIPGQQGPKGENGERGNVGLSGKPGPKGQDCFNGDKGGVGFPGNTGATGLRGKDGDPGSKGEQGTRGELGPSGEPGERGIRGPLGLPGRNGDPGERGDSGTSGLPGTDGKKGDKGEAGKPGPPGGAQSISTDNNVLRIKGETGEPGLKGETGLPGPTGPEGKPGPPGPALGAPGPARDGGEKPGSKGEHGLRGETGLKGERGDQGRGGIAGMPGLPGTPGRPGIDGKRGLTGKDGDRGMRGDDGKKGEKGEAATNGKDGTKGEAGAPGLPGTQVLVTPEGATVDEMRQAFTMPMGPPGAPGPAGIKGDKGETGFKGDKGDAGPPGRTIEMKDIEVMFEGYGIRLSLLKALIDRLLQDGMEELLQVLDDSRRTNKEEDVHRSNVITELKSSVTFDLPKQSDVEMELDRQLQEPLSADSLNEGAEGPTPWSVTSLNGQQELGRVELGSKGMMVMMAEEDGREISSRRMNLTAVNSTFNHTTPRERVVVETAILSQGGDSVKKSSAAEKRKHKDRGGKGKGNKGRHKRQRQRLASELVVDEEDEEPIHNDGEYSYDYEEKLSTEDTLTSWDGRGEELHGSTHDSNHFKTSEDRSSNSSSHSHRATETQEEDSTAMPTFKTQDKDKDIS